ncbi:tRNA (N6-isopentenyl adenosine(37)-C2)-methylthiotransferase MiaB [Blattabacterium cuenoti]|uniref:tRNA (N6-isopentenyl adenosine(37)-C2)-methylthiotransferase MiaB n=1 Tax=Blattabacterium cuenoti TaxID=1653831 RepID=UPI00163CB8FC|nr:tRNA (N6-isopentenyl adenosine(37)-C2)-methylthiotransferase MiaB [Blattabacterium cuenoti]
MEEKKKNKSENFFYIENFGCQMNLSDSEIVASILLKCGYQLSQKVENANLILFNSCSIRKKAEISLKKKIDELEYLRKKNGIFFGIIGCISKSNRELLDKKIDFFLNPNAYKKIPYIIRSLNQGELIKKNNILSQKETYEDILPFRFLNQEKIKTFLSITRGCNNMCTFCIVPFTRGREISRSPNSILHECHLLYKEGYKEITLLGQNVDSYKWIEPNSNHKKKIIDFSNLLRIIAENLPFMRIRFSTSNPHDMSEQVLKVIAQNKNICKHIHLPVQSGSNKILKLMNRKYTREEYLFLIEKIKSIIPECSISHDIMTGFCNENEKDHLDTIDLMNQVKYNYGYMFSYSPRPGTYAYRNLKNNVPDHIKKRRLEEIISLQRKHSLFRMKEYLGKLQEVLIERISKKSDQYWYGKNSQNLGVVFPKKNFKVGDIVHVKIKTVTSATLIGNIV